jgi:hypothetical protein
MAGGNDPEDVMASDMRPQSNLIGSDRVKILLCMQERGKAFALFWHRP